MSELTGSSRGRTDAGERAILILTFLLTIPVDLPEIGLRTGGIAVRTDDETGAWSPSTWPRAQAARRCRKSSVPHLPCSWRRQQMLARLSLGGRALILRMRVPYRRPA
jgi:hypothetical protein